jgi:hypothetical protein
MAVFTGAADALTVGVAIQQALDRHSGSGGPARLEVRIGLSARDVTVEEADCFGTPGRPDCAHWPKVARSSPPRSSVLWPDRQAGTGSGRLGPST